MESKQDNGSKKPGKYRPQDYIQLLARAKDTLVGIKSSDWSVVSRGLMQAGAGISPPMEVLVWTPTKGFHDVDGNTIKNEANPINAIRSITSEKGRFIIVIRQAQMFLDNPMFRMALLETAEDLQKEKKEDAKIIVLLAPDLNLPLDIEDQVHIVNWPLPDREDVSKVLNWVIDGLSDKLKESQPNGEVRDSCVSAAMGLTEHQAVSAFSRCLVDKKTIDPAYIANQKKQVVEKLGILKWIDCDYTMDDIGGNRTLKKWLEQRKDGFSKRARAWGLPTPRGAFFFGPPGTGKTLSAKACAANWGVPLLAYSSTVLSKWQGESEQRMQSVLDVAGTVSPCVLFIDEVEKSLAGVGGSGETDGGTSSRTFGMLLSFMQDRTDPVFIVATANDPRGLPPEFLRRFDERFFVDLPDADDRADIASRVLSRYDCPHTIEQVDMMGVAEVSDGFSGAEIEDSLRAAMYRAFSDGERPVTAADWIYVLRKSTPVSKTMSDRIDELREWAKGRATLASEKTLESASMARKIEL